MKRILVLTGAGMSAESGLGTFRDAGGLWEKYKIDDVATPYGWKKNPALVLDFYNQRREQALNAQPNNGHLALAKLEEKYNIQIITQNVDDLHERAGSTNVLHLHGELMKVRSTGPGQEVYELEPSNYQVNIGTHCPKEFQLRPHIVWFGEEVSEIEKAEQLLDDADIFVIIGTSLQVYPAAGLLHNLKRNIPVFLIDPNTIHQLPSNVKVISKGASDGLIELAELLNTL